MFTAPKPTPLLKCGWPKNMTMRRIGVKLQGNREPPLALTTHLQLPQTLASAAMKSTKPASFAMLLRRCMFSIRYSATPLARAYLCAKSGFDRFALRVPSPA